MNIFILLIVYRNCISYPFSYFSAFFPNLFSIQALCRFLGLGLYLLCFIVLNIFNNSILPKEILDIVKIYIVKNTLYFNAFTFLPNTLIIVLDFLRRSIIICDIKSGIMKDFLSNIFCGNSIPFFFLKVLRKLKLSFGFCQLPYFRFSSS